jgi:hypothetical protein
MSAQRSSLQCELGDNEVYIDIATGVERGYMYVYEACICMKLPDCSNTQRTGHEDKSVCGLSMMGSAVTLSELNPRSYVPILHLIGLYLRSFQVYLCVV